MICTVFDSYMAKLCHKELMISWQTTLTDGTIVYGDYERPELDNPWDRLSKHCSTNNVVPAKIELYMFGAEHKVFFEDPDGLDGVSILRGIAKEQTMDGSHSQSFQTLTVSLLRDSCDYIDVAKYTWPHNNFEQKESVRGLSNTNLQNMIFKNGSTKLNNPKIQEYLHIATV
ncbi:uncharacterized protein METZ01_LOCUS195834 [marine metagenome]|jgi:hypothetical protein|uniref:Uncharacterized protein n=1 Tax=marine metagenome TaxID=408172 RepID=A0A382DX03_9ZZZZ